MNLSKYRDTSDYKEILRLFQKSSEREDNLLWQNVDGKRVQSKVDHLEIDFVGREVVVYLDNPQTIDSSHCIYFKLSFNDTIFKHTNYYIQPDSVTFKFPENLKTWELRSQERFFVDEKDECTVVISSSADSDASGQLKVKLHDFSAQGLGVSLSTLSSKAVADSKHFWLHTVNDYKLTRPIIAEVMHSTSDVSGKRLKLGLYLHKALPIEAVQSILE